MSLKNDKIPSSAAFDLISEGLKSDPAEAKKAIKQANGIFAFVIKNGSDTGAWYIDLKEKGEVGTGKAPAGKKPTVTVNITDSDFQSLIDGSGNAQKLFMGGKLKVQGDVMKATKLDAVLKKAQSNQKAKL